jgi:hypothetical protein
MKEVVDREMRGGSTGVNVRMAKGVTYRVGRVRARSVVVGSHLDPADSGDLVVTDRRAVFMGAKKTLERFETGLYFTVPLPISLLLPLRA